MYIFVTVQNREDYYSDGPSNGRIKVRLELASGERCLAVPYQEVSMKTVREVRPRAIAISGFGGHFQDMKVSWFRGIDEVLHQADLPILCFCGSHQLLAFSYNRDLGKVKRLHDEPMRKLSPSEDVPRRAKASSTEDYSAYLVGDGFVPITRLVPDPIFRGLPKTMIMRCSHYCEVKKLPRRFTALASSGHCRIEAMRHDTRPLYGTQFHPEAYEEPWLHGKVLLENFARIVDGFWKKKGNRAS